MNKPSEPGLYLCDQRGAPLRHPIYFDGTDGWYAENHLVWWEGDGLENFRRLVVAEEAKRRFPPFVKTAEDRARFLKSLEKIPSEEALQASTPGPQKAPASVREPGRIKGHHWKVIPDGDRWAIQDAKDIYYRLSYGGEWFHSCSATWGTEAVVS